MYGPAVSKHSEPQKCCIYDYLSDLNNLNNNNNNIFLLIFKWTDHKMITSTV